MRYNNHHISDFSRILRLKKDMVIIMKEIDYNFLKELLKSRLNEKRYKHSLAVADEARRLAAKYGADEEKSYLAGLLHDITKNSPREEHLNIFNTFGIILDDVENNSEKLWHAVSGAAFVRNILKIDDEQIVDAIRYHTTARADMPLLSKILYLADFTSADRDYDDVDVIRALVDKSLNEAFVYALKYSIVDLVKCGRAVHTDTLKAYNQAVLKKTVKV